MCGCVAVDIQDILVFLKLIDIILPCTVPDIISERCKNLSSILQRWELNHRVDNVSHLWQNQKLNAEVTFSHSSIWIKITVQQYIFHICQPYLCNHMHCKQTVLDGKGQNRHCRHLLYLGGMLVRYLIFL